MVPMAFPGYGMDRRGISRFGAIIGRGRTGISNNISISGIFRKE